MFKSILLFVVMPDVEFSCVVSTGFLYIYLYTVLRFGLLRFTAYCRMVQIGLLISVMHLLGFRARENAFCMVV